MTFQPDLKLREKCFRRMGDNWAVIVRGGQKVGWICHSTDERFDNLPPIETSWEVCAEYLVPFMREKGWGLHISISEGDQESYFNWGRNDKPPFAVGVDIVDDNIPLATCKAFMEVKLGNFFKNIKIENSEEGFKLDE